MNLLWIVLIVILVLALGGSHPHWQYAQNWGYAPFGGIGVVLVIVIILLLLRII
jgi:sterol desaturase/sphingolipid hydroxylase (fatty acid hydroxylase superfamily)